MGLHIRNIPNEVTCSGIKFSSISEPIGQWGCVNDIFNHFKQNNVWWDVFHSLGNHGDCNGFLLFLFARDEREELGRNGNDI